MLYIIVYFGAKFVKIEVESTKTFLRHGYMSGERLPGNVKAGSLIYVVGFTYVSICSHHVTVGKYCRKNEQINCCFAFLALDTEAG